MTWKPLPRDNGDDGTGPEPRRLTDSLDRISRSLGGPSATTLATIFERWSDIVGPLVAAHSRPVTLHRGTLTIAVDQPGWATQLTYLETDLRRRIDEVSEGGAVQRVRVIVRPKSGPTW